MLEERLLMIGELAPFMVPAMTEKIQEYGNMVQLNMNCGKELLLIRGRTTGNQDLLLV